MRRTTYLLASISLLLFALSACGADEGDEARPFVSTPITAEGGTVTSADGALSLDLPSGAVPAGTTVTVFERNVGGEPDLATAVYELGPDGLTLDKPVTLVIKVAGAKAGEDYVLKNYDTREDVEGSAWDPEKSELSGVLRHFSSYAGFRRVVTTYDPCAGKECGDSCSICDPADQGCTETAEVKVCHKDGTCSGAAPDCDDTPPPVYDPCEGKKCGTECSVCPPDDDDCVETAVLKVCHKDGTCSGKAPDCDGPDKPKACGGFAGLPCPDGMDCVDDPSDDCDPKAGGADCIGICVEKEPPPYEPCAGKECGDACTVCDPSDPSCAETGVLKVCHKDGTCSADAADCEEPPPPYEPCAGKECGDACTICDPTDPDCDETAVLKVCHEDGTCSGAAPDCEEQPQACGGFAGLMCPDDLVCVDDPSDDCDPNAGGADCMGICVDPELKWYRTCGDPVCGQHRPPTDGTPACSDEVEGKACPAEGDTCYIADDGCNARLLCTTTDPKEQGCPISKREAKEEIRYLDAAALREVKDTLMEVRLARWRYKGEPEGPASRLGYVIGDPGAGPVLPSGERVDLYSFASMAAAAVQVQAAELATLREELAALRVELEELRGEGGVCR